MTTKKSKVKQVAENAGISTEKAPETVQANHVNVNRPKGKVLSSAAGFHNFTTEPEFQGYSLKKQVIDPNDNRIIGYEFVDDNGVPCIIGNAGAIEKALTAESAPGVPYWMTDEHFYIAWSGKIEMKNGKSFNKYDVIVLE